MKLLECVPNFSEGRNLEIINEIVDAIKQTENVYVLDVDPGASTNRTVVTFVGEPEAVIEAAFQGIKKASELIDMSKHSGEHPRMGATDVCPLIPISGISDEEAVLLAEKLAKRVGEELKIPVYLYEKAAKKTDRKNLAVIREGEYEGLPEKLKNPRWKPDFGPAEFNARSGATVIGVRDFLIAYNINLNTKSVRRANSVAFDLREKGRLKREGNPLTGKIVRDENGKPVRIPGVLKGVKAIGWYIEEYGIAQVSMNITDIQATPLHKAFEEAVKSADRRGMRVTGSELVGMVPKKVLVDAGKYFLKKQNRSRGIPEEEIIFIAVKSLGLDELAPFDPTEKIIEYKLEKLQGNSKKLINLNIREFANETASESPAPGGGSVSALAGAIGSALGAMVANLSANKRGWDDKVDYYSEFAEKLLEIKEELLQLIDEDTQAFNKIMEAGKLPAKNEEQKRFKKKALEDATKYAVEVPLKTMQMCVQAFPYVEEMAKTGNPNSITDVAVGAWNLWSGVNGALLNVRINLTGIDDKEYLEKIQAQTRELLQKAEEYKNRILQITEEKLTNA